MARPREFDPRVALDKAVRVFWRHGYAATSMSDLEEVMQLGRQSIYNAFGDKRGLYLAALERYAAQHIERPLEILKRPGAGLSAIRRYFRLQVDFYITQRPRGGCMVGNTAVELAPHDREVAERVRGYLSQMEEALYGALVNARAKGQTQSDQRDRALAAFLVCTVISLGVASKAGLPEATLRGIAGVSLSTLD